VKNGGMGETEYSARRQVYCGGYVPPDLTHAYKEKC
jgi:hypothetical protein